MSDKTLFEKLDGNNDGVLSMEEFRMTGWFSQTTLEYFKELLPLNQICIDVWKEIEVKMIENRTRK